MSETHSVENDVRTQWGVESPTGEPWTYSDPVIARIVSKEQRKPVLRRTVTMTPWETDPDNVGYAIPPDAPSSTGQPR